MTKSTEISKRCCCCSKIMFVKPSHYELVHYCNLGCKTRHENTKGYTPPRTTQEIMKDLFGDLNTIPKNAVDPETNDITDFAAGKNDETSDRPEEGTK